MCVSREEKKRYFCEIFSVIEDLEKQNPFPGEMEKRGGAEKRRKRDLRLKFWIRVIRLETISTEVCCEALYRTVRSLSIFKQCVGKLLTPYSIEDTCGAYWRCTCVGISP